MVDLLDDDDLLDLRPRSDRTSVDATTKELRRKLAVGRQDQGENDALKAWLKERDAPATPSESSSRRCYNCGTAVPIGKGWTMLGLCQQCAKSTRPSEEFEDEDWMGS